MTSFMEFTIRSLQGDSLSKYICVSLSFVGQTFPLGFCQSSIDHQRSEKLLTEHLNATWLHLWCSFEPPYANVFGLSFICFIGIYIYISRIYLQNFLHTMLAIKQWSIHICVCFTCVYTYVIRRVDFSPFRSIFLPIILVWVKKSK